MEIGPLAQNEVPWLLERSAETGWAQLTPAQQQMVAREVVTANAQSMLTQALGSPGAAVFVAREGTELIGYLVVVIVPDELTGQATGLFLDVWVDPRYRGRALASQLGAAGEAHLRGRGVKSTRRFIAAHNEASLRHAAKEGCRIERYMMAKDI